MLEGVKGAPKGDFGHGRAAVMSHIYIKSVWKYWCQKAKTQKIIFLFNIFKKIDVFLCASEKQPLNILTRSVQLSDAVSHDAGVFESFAGFAKSCFVQLPKPALVSSYLASFHAYLSTFVLMWLITRVCLNPDRDGWLNVKKQKEWVEEERVFGVKSGQD